MNTTAYFESLLDLHGDSPRALDWSEYGQRERFRVLYESGIRFNHSVLDVGCGLGHFYDYIVMKQDHVGAYEGLDISERFLQAARKRRPNSYFSKLNENWLTDTKRKLPEFDFIVSSGMLNVKGALSAPDYYPMIMLMRRMFESCKVGCAINMLSTETPKIQKRPDRMYYPPQAVLGWALLHTKNVVLRHDYLPNDLTIVMRKSW